MAVLTVNGEYKSSSKCLLGESVQGWLGLLSRGAVLVSVQAWQEGENPRAFYHLRAIKVDLSNFLSCRIMTVSSDSLADHAIFKPAWRTLGSLGSCGSSGVVGTGALLIQVSKLHVHHFHAQHWLVESDRKSTWK